MVMRLFLLYAVIELAVLIALTATIGFGWTVLALLASFVLGVALAGSQLRRQLDRLRRGFANQGNAGAQVTDSALIAMGTVLVFIPGLVTTIAGLLMLAPATRTVLAPAAGTLAARQFSRRVAFVGHRDYIDGEIIDIDDPRGYDPSTPLPMRPMLLPKPE